MRAGVKGPAPSGVGKFSKSLPQNGRAVIPAGVDGLMINLNSANDLAAAAGHPVVISGEGGAGAKVTLDIDLVVQSEPLTVGPGIAGNPVTLSVKQPVGILTIHGTVVVSNYSRLQWDRLATVSNVGGVLRTACRGTVVGVSGLKITRDSCFWDGWAPRATGLKRPTGIRIPCRRRTTGRRSVPLPAA